MENYKKVLEELKVKMGILNHDWDYPTCENYEYNCGGLLFASRKDAQRYYLELGDKLEDVLTY